MKMYTVILHDVIVNFSFVLKNEDSVRVDVICAFATSCVTFKFEWHKYTSWPQKWEFLKCLQA